MIASVFLLRYSHSFGVLNVGPPSIEILDTLDRDLSSICAPQGVAIGIGAASQDLDMDQGLGELYASYYLGWSEIDGQTGICRNRSGFVVRNLSQNFRTEFSRVGNANMRVAFHDAVVAGSIYASEWDSEPSDAFIASVDGYGGVRFNYIEHNRVEDPTAPTGFVESVKPGFQGFFALTRGTAIFKGYALRSRDGAPGETITDLTAFDL